MIRVHLICEATRQNEADTFLTELWGTDQSGSFSVPLSASGSAPWTHFGCSGVYQPSQLDAIHAVPWLEWSEQGSFAEFVASHSLAEMTTPVPG